MTLEELQTRVTVTHNCWIWLGPVNRNGYGYVKRGGRKVMAHRLAYMLKHGPIPAGYVVDHLCRVRQCCNPDHLEAVTVQENTRRGLAVLFAPLED